MFMFSGQAHAQVEPDPPIECGPCEAWNAPLIDSSIRALGFRTDDIRLIVNSHAHFDHAGGIAFLQRLTNAVVAASAAGAAALQRGTPTPDDPQFSLGGPFPPVSDVRVVRDGESLRVGDVEVTARYTPGHTPGATTWTWVSCEAETCLKVVYADSLNAISADEYRFSSPGIEAQFRQSIQTVAELPCDILLAVHPGFTGMRQKLEARATQPAADPFVDGGACRQYAAAALGTLDERLARERQ